MGERPIIQSTFERRVPKNVNIEITSRCNLKCKYCPAAIPGAPHHDMDFDYYKTIVDRINFETIMVPYLGGEPLLHPRLYDMIKYALDKDLFTYITTNGTIWNEKFFDLALRGDTFYQIIVSIDGLWDEKSRSIELARPGSVRSVVKRTVDKLLELKLKLNSKTDVSVKITKRGQDFEELETYIAYWLKTNGVDFVVLGEALTENDTEGFRIYPCQYCDDVFMTIRWNGRMPSCFYNPKVINGELNSMGYLDETTPLIEAFNNPLYREFRERQRKLDFPEACAHCGFAYTGAGFKGVLTFRDERHGYGETPIYYRRDHYNHFFSLKEKARSNKFYGYRDGTEASLRPT